MVGQGPGTRFEARNRSGESVHVHSHQIAVAGRGGRGDIGRARAGARAGAGQRQDRPDPADDRRPGLDRQADRQRDQAVHAAERRHRRRQEDRDHPEGRRRRSRQHQAPRAGTDRQRQGQFHCRLRRHAGGAGRRAAGDAGQDPGSRDGGGHLDHHRAFALHRAHQFHAGAILHHHRRLGGQERHQEGRDADLRLRARQRCAELLQGAFHGRRRRDRRGGQGPPGQSRFRAVPAADEGCQARRHVRVRSGRAGRQLHEAICRARARQVRHQGDRPRRRHGRRSAQRHGRCGARHRHRAYLFRGPSVGDEQGFRRRLQEGLRLPPGLHGGERL